MLKTGKNDINGNVFKHCFSYALKADGLHGPFIGTC